MPTGVVHTLQFNNNVVLVNGERFNSDLTGPSVSLDVKQRVNYVLPTTVTSLTFTGVKEEYFGCCDIVWETPSTDPTFNIPATGWYCSGSDCSSGAFTPKADTIYILSVIEYPGYKTIIFVHKLS